MRLVFLGTPQSAVPSLEALIANDHEPALVVTRPDRPVGRSGRPVPPAVKRAALAHGLEVEQPRRVRGAVFARRLGDCGPDLLVVVAYGKILPRSVLESAPRGAVNLHFSLLPAYRGAAPVQWSLANGEPTTGITTMLMNERMDEGDVLLQREIAIEADEHAPVLAARLAAAGAALLVETLAGLEAGAIDPRPQDHRRATQAPMLTVADGEIDLRLPAVAVAGRVRGFDPWPGVWVRRAGKRLRIVDARKASGITSEPPGRVEALTDEGLIVACGEGTRLALLRVQPEGRRVLDVGDAVNGRQIGPGDQLEPVAR